MLQKTIDPAFPASIGNSATGSYVGGKAAELASARSSGLRGILSRSRIPAFARGCHGSSAQLKVLGDADLFMR